MKLQHNIFTVSAIYQATHPEYALYLYLMAPISLAILNPVAFVLMEIHKQREIRDSAPIQIIDENQRKADVCKLKLIRQIVKGIAFNPVLVMTVLGILGNILFKHQLSIYIEGLLQVSHTSMNHTLCILNFCGYDVSLTYNHCLCLSHFYICNDDVFVILGIWPSFLFNCFVSTGSSDGWSNIQAEGTCLTVTLYPDYGQTVSLEQ